MAEIAIPILALGGMYILSNQDKKKSEYRSLSKYAKKKRSKSRYIRKFSRSA